MRLLPASLGGRLALGGVLFTFAALLVTLVVMDSVIERFVTGQIDQRLDNKLVALASQVRVASDGSISLEGDADGPPFDEPRLRSFWWIGGPRNALESRWLKPGAFVPPSAADIAAAPAPPLRRPDADAEAPPAPRARTIRAPGPDEMRMHMRVVVRDYGSVHVTILAAAARQAIEGPMREALTTLGTAILVLGCAMIVAGAWFGYVVLKPLGRLRHDVADVRVGRRESLPPDQLSEIRPLVEELNSLLAQNAANLARARNHVANLAHGLKTPLATLALGVARLDDEAKRRLEPLVETIERRVRHHLGRARAAALEGPVRAQTQLGLRLRDLIEVLQKVHADKRVVVTIDCAVGLIVACEPQDVDEILGNLLENAFKYTRATIVCTVRDVGGGITTEIVDDGPGLTASEIDRVLRPGQRLDENVPGFGFGLPIARELVELYGGALVLTPLSKGLRVEVTLPVAR